MLVETLHKQSGMPVAYLHWIAYTASRRYRTYEIPKRSGASRTIHHPSKRLKSLQRWLNKFLFKQLPVHSSARAYVKGMGIRQNASDHARFQFTLRLDFKDFFPSFTAVNVLEFLASRNREQSLNLSDADLAFVSRIVSRDGQLTIGAPSSPMLTNAMMYSFDNAIFVEAERIGITYTRYADDLFFSTNASNKLERFISIVKENADRFPYARLRINEEKTCFLSRKYQRRLTGLIVTPEGNISVGREKKRAIKSLVHKFIIGKLDLDRIAELTGHIAYVRDVDRDFYDSLIKKYGADNIQRILRPSQT